MVKLIVLDRDGVINEDSDDYIKSPEEFIPVPGSLQAIASLNRAGYTVVVASNQSGLARGYFSEQTLQQMHDKLERLLEEVGGKIEKIYYCPHGPDDNCDCRKPKPGLLLQIIADYNVEGEDVVAVGDSLRDLQAAQAVNMIPVLVRTGKGLRTESSLKNEDQMAGQFKNINIFDNLQQAVRHLLNNA